MFPFTFTHHHILIYSLFASPAQVAQSLTTRPVKGMLTGPVTILNWSFPRKDLSRRAQAFQLALALRKVSDQHKQPGCCIRRHVSSSHLTYESCDQLCLAL